MGVSEHVINAASAVVAIEYMDYGFQKKYNGARRRGSFTVGCAVYFLTVSALNMVIELVFWAFFMELF